MVEVGELVERLRTGKNPGQHLGWVVTEIHREAADALSDLLSECQSSMAKIAEERARAETAEVRCDELQEALSAANYYVALYEAEHESNIALDVYTRAARALAGKGVKG